MKLLSINRLSRAGFAAFLFAAGLYAACPAPGHCITLLTRDEAIRRLFPESTSAAPLLFKVSSANIAELRKELGNRAKSEAGNRVLAAVLEAKEHAFYVCRNNGSFLGWMIELDVPGKWGPIKFAVAMDADGAVSSVIVMAYTETRGRPIASRNFLNQFKGKSLADPIALGVDIRAVSGATVSSEAARMAVTAAAALYKEFRPYGALEKSKNPE